MVEFDGIGFELRTIRRAFDEIPGGEDPSRVRVIRAEPFGTATATTAVREAAFPGTTVITNVSIVVSCRAAPWR